MPTSRALGDYLRTRRELTRPEDVGITVGPGTRRVPGLRRSEVAQLAGISAEYYVKLEQGQESNPTAQVLDALSRAFRLDAAARAYLHALTRKHERVGIDPSPSALTHARWLIDSWPLTAAMIHDRHLDIVASNSLMQALVPAYRASVNSLAVLMLDPALRALYLEWDGLTARSVAMLRATLGTQPDDVRSLQLITKLTRESERFRELWTRHDVVTVTEGIHPIAHPTAGPLTLHYTNLRLTGGDGDSMFLYYCEPGTESADALARLAAGW